MQFLNSNANRKVIENSRRQSLHGKQSIKEEEASRRNTRKDNLIARYGIFAQFAELAQLAGLTITEHVGELLRLLIFYIDTQMQRNKTDRIGP